MKIPYLRLVFFAIVVCMCAFRFGQHFGNNRKSADIWYKPRTNYFDGMDIENRLEQHRGSKINIGDVKTRIIVDGKFMKRVNGSNCKLKEVQLSNESLPVTGLVSFPGSGNTWTRHLIQQMTGIGSSSVYCDGSLRRGGFPFECDRQWNRTIVVKAHGYKHTTKFEKIVLIIRNPYDTYLAFSNFKEEGHTGKLPGDELVEVSEKLKKCCDRYSNLIKSVIEDFKGPVYVLQYERLKTDMANELRKLAAFLNVSVSERDIRCTVKMQEGNFHRKADESEHIEQLRTLYSDDKLSQLREAARMSEGLLKKAYNIDFDLGGPFEKVLFDNDRF